VTKYERVQHALQGCIVDRVPVSVWMHYPSVDQDARMLAEKQVEYQKRYDLDFIKLMPFGLYSAQDWGCRVRFFCDDVHPPVVERHGIDHVEDWASVEVLPPTFGNWGQQLQLTRYVYKLVGRDVPFVQTIFSPLTTAYKLAGDRIFSDIKTHPKLVHHALEAITETTRQSIIANIQAGASGIFFATQCANYDMMTEIEYAEFGSRYDIPSIEEANRCGAWFNILHMHGNQVMFDDLASYPVQALNWHDRQIMPDLISARKRTDKCLIGGLNEKGAISIGTPDEVTQEVWDTINESGSSKLMIGPGCVAYPDTPGENVYAARLAVETFIEGREKP